MKQKIPVIATFIDGHVYVDSGAGTAVEGSITLHWNNGDLAGARDYSKEGKLVGIEILDVLNEISETVHSE
ncbi:hypothetical protein CMUST_11575 [Corynebacterium mustelae]|uniref:DUF2283 domain-containing protein n=1 Tax=Corynebacterium mustelae TaxID=571915 RepID=A0A0G3GZS9_9CORY|nr:DUF2283 domain-containing protein [Corynebacterium mustelae]AKK06626.1 hypothetical protein CMUST_11575 [Corynebacterium mustelae]